MLLGGFRDVSIMDELTDVEITTPTIQASLERFLGELIGEEPRITHRWAGIFGLTQDMLPLVGRVPGRDALWVAAGYSGHGNVLGFACGELVADAILGETGAAARAVRPCALRLEIERRRVLRLVEQQLDAAGQEHRRRDPEALLVRLAAELDALCRAARPSSPRGRRTSGRSDVTSRPRTDARRSPRAAA